MSRGRNNKKLNLKKTIIYKHIVFTFYTTTSFIYNVFIQQPYSILIQVENDDSRLHGKNEL